jgi:hypothetical protein
MDPDALGADPVPSKPERKWLRWAVPVGALIVGLGVGVGVGALALQRNPTGTEEYQSLQEELDTAYGDLAAARGEIAGAQDLVLEAQADARAAGDEADMRSAELDQREADVAAREAAVTAVEAQVAANSIGEGIWTVGVDIEPGTYRTAEALTGYCYWATLRSGTNGDDIIQNDGPEGGYPTVTLSEGQDFENSGCGTFVKQ